MMALATILCLALGAAIYAVMLGWDTTDAAPYSSLIPGPYAPWQIKAVLVATSAVALLASLRLPWAVVWVGSTLGFSTAWLIQGLMSQPGPLIAVGLIVVTLVIAPFSFAGACAGLGLRAVSHRRRGRRNEDG